MPLNIQIKKPLKSLTLAGSITGLTFLPGCLDICQNQINTTAYSPNLIQSNLFIQAAYAKSKGKNTVEPSEEHYKEGSKRYLKDDYDGAIDSFLQAIYFARNNYNPQAYFFLALCYKAKNQDAKAIDAFKKHLEQVTGPSPDAHVELAEIYMRNDRLNEAENELKDAIIEYRGPGPKAHNMYGLLLERRGDLSGAGWHYRTALGDPPWTYTAAWMNYADLYMKKGQYSDALEQWRNMNSRRLELKGIDFQRMNLNMGQCLLQRGDHQGAIDCWHNVLGLNPDNPMAHLFLALILDQEKHYSSSLTHYRQYLRLYPDAPNIQKVKDRLAFIEQSIKPQEAMPQQAKPSPYMRKQEEEEAKQNEPQDESSIPQSGESGF